MSAVALSDWASRALFFFNKDSGGKTSVVVGTVLSSVRSRSKHKKVQNVVRAASFHSLHGVRNRPGRTDSVGRHQVLNIRVSLTFWRPLLIRLVVDLRTSRKVKKKNETFFHIQEKVNLELN